MVANNNNNAPMHQMFPTTLQTLPKAQMVLLCQIMPVQGAEPVNQFIW